MSATFAAMDLQISCVIHLEISDELCALQANDCLKSYSCLNFETISRPQGTKLLLFAVCELLPLSRLLAHSCLTQFSSWKGTRTVSNKVNRWFLLVGKLGRKKMRAMQEMYVGNVKCDRVKKHGVPKKTFRIFW